ncbi:lipopolysaccharide heptosyltransferase II [Phycisphaerales bacterium AB-hyl4]|uniref:lipopolysaccharide heptosyltransferase II n=1 Tax=Natronomicrosphaera hydrolytica TaxID=3242702 RepID=A0ABV4U0N8_9BACT
MVARHANQPVQRLLVVMPTWLGDVIMATPTLRALRELYPEAHVAGLVRESVRPILAGCPWLNELIGVRHDRGEHRPTGLARRLAAEQFDTAVLLPNSFRTAMAVAMARIPRRVGYDREGRGLLLTDRLLPSPLGRSRLAVPTLDYYLAIACYMGAASPGHAMALFTEPGEEQSADALLQRVGWEASGDRPLVLLNPGSQRASKRWPADRFAAVADHCARQWQAQVALIGAPDEQPIAKQVIAAADTALLNLPAEGLDLATLKAVVRRSSLVITNDSGPRHLAAAFGVPVVTLFGPTAPRWTEIHFADERQVLAPGTAASMKAVDESDACRMDRIEVDAVLEAVTALMTRSEAEDATASTAEPPRKEAS